MKIWGENEGQRKELKNRAARERSEIKSEQPFEGYGPAFAERNPSSHENILTALDKNKVHQAVNIRNAREGFSTLGFTREEAEEKIQKKRSDARAQVEDIQESIASNAREKLDNGHLNDVYRLNMANFVIEKMKRSDHVTRGFVAEELKNMRKHEKRQIHQALEEWQFPDNSGWLNLEALPYIFREKTQVIKIITEAVEKLSPQERSQVFENNIGWLPDRIDSSIRVKKGFVVDLIKQGKLTEKTPKELGLAGQEPLQR